MKPHSISHLSVALSSEVGANDALIAVRVVPAGRDGNKVLGRTLAEGEHDCGEKVDFYPYAGEELHFPPGSVKVYFHDIDKESAAGADGYAPISNALWTWLNFGKPVDPNLFRFLLAAARRLDTAHFLCADVMADLTLRSEPYIKARQRLLGILGRAELMCVALGRAIDMLEQLPKQFSVRKGLPDRVVAVSVALREIRNAFEHIEDRALGNVRGKPHADALSIFDQRKLISHGVLTYASYSLNLSAQIVPVLIDSRRFILEVATTVAGAARTLNDPISFPSASPGSYDRIQERAYFLWQTRSGTTWWDADANWCEAERLDASIVRASS